MTRPHLVRRFRHALQRSDTLGPLALSVAAGVMAGMGAIALRWMIRGVQWLFFDQGTQLGAYLHLPIPPAVVTVVGPALGMVMVAYIVKWWAEEAKGHGIPEVQFAVRMRGGRIRPRVAFVKAIASALSIGTGGSLGREGAIVQIGASMGSAMAQFAGLGAAEVKLMVAAASAGAIGATFNAPIAGVLFALEVVLGSFAARSFGLVVVASVTAVAVAQAALGTEPAFHLVEQFRLVSDWELALYPLLGVVAGLVALLYVHVVYGVEDWFDRWHTRLWIKALVGGLAVGLLGTFGSPHLFGIGHEGVELAMAGALSTGLMLALVFMKIFATSVTLGAGGSGGVFAPALFIGAMTGGVFGRTADALFPNLNASPGAYALVGSAALFGAAAHAPMTAIIIVFEMTDNYRIILPLMLAVVVAQLLASRIDPDSIYSIKLRRRGAMVSPRAEMGTLDLLLVADAMTEEVPTVAPGLPLDHLADRARDERCRSWVVVDDRGRMVGIVAVTDLERAIVEGDLEGLAVRDVMTRALVTCAPGETLRYAFRRFTERDVYQIPVVDPADPGVVVGMLRRTEMMWAYKELADEHQRLMERTDALQPERRFESTHVEIQVTRSHRGVCDHAIREIRVPDHALIALLRRGERVVVPRGFTKVEPGDILTLITTRQYEGELRDWIVGLTSGR
ncbi:MAG TPA: chloride channel protein [Longimicrobiales bacterium]|nr:chloride channel protein [Longimicrobiales bacterium]